MPEMAGKDGTAPPPPRSLATRISNGCVIALLVGLVLGYVSCRVRNGIVLDRFLGAEAIAIIREAERVESYRLSPPPRPTDAASDIAAFEEDWRTRIDPERITARGANLSTQQTAELKDLLLSPGSYRLSVRKQCLPRAGVGLRLYAGSRTADVLLCFECDMLGLASPDDRQQAGWEDFDPVRPQLVRLVKELFPEDFVILGLRESTH